MACLDFLQAVIVVAMIALASGYSGWHIGRWYAKRYERACDPRASRGEA